uniref:Mitochondrial GTPase 1 n=1 Tax=Catagonus wagneri TaxID=51154 RepID=A0A8C3WBD7_9CETA
MKLTQRALCAVALGPFRESFPLGGRDVASSSCLPGLRKMQNSLKRVDCILEVSFGGCDIAFVLFWLQETLGLKPHSLVLNKMDVADLKEQQKIIRHLEGEGLKNGIFTNCVKDENIKQVSPKVTELIGSSYCYHRGEVCERPPVFLLDTPGVLAPQIQSVETGLKLALCGTVLDHLVGEETLADYLLYTLNRHQLLGYMQHYGLGQACDDIASVLKRVAVRLRTQKVKVLTGTGAVHVVQPNYPAATRDFLRAFHSGLLGPVMLDRDVLQGVPAVGP